MAADDDKTFETLKRAFIEGIPRRPLAAERQDGERIYETLAKLGGEQLVGGAKSLPQGLYLDGPRDG